MTIRHQMLAAFVLIPIVLAGCSNNKCCGVASGPCDGCPPSAGSAAVRGEPVSPGEPGAEGRFSDPRDPGEPPEAAVESKDARAGEEAERLSGNPLRVPEIEIKNLSRDGRIWIGGEPTIEGYRQVHERGVTAIVDLRNPTPKQKEGARQAARLGVAYINLPIQPKSMTPEDADRFLAFMKEHEGEQVLIHCGSANRASAMYAVYLGRVKGLSPDEAIRRARTTGLREAELESDVREYLSKPKADDPSR